MINLDNFSEILSADTESGVVTFQSGLRLRDLTKELAKRGLSMPNLGSIDEQSVAGVISTGTHGSSLNHGLISESISSMKLILANGQVVQCSGSTNPSLFRAALLSLGALGIIVEITFRAVSDFKIEWTQTLEPLSKILDTWDTTLWTSAEFTRVWWLPYGDTGVVWRAHKTDKSLAPPPKSYYSSRFGYHTYHCLLWLAQCVPRINPWVEWFVFGMQYGFKPGARTSTAVQFGREGLLMDCLYSQFVNEWALPLKSGPEAITRLREFLRNPKDHSRISGIPYSSAGLYVHSPIEVRVSDTSGKTGLVDANSRPLLDPTCRDEPTLYLNATLYRPYLRDPPCTDRYYQAFEYLMREMKGRPHWAKNFTAESSPEIADMYGEDLQDFMKIRDEVDPNGMFLGEWHRRNLPLHISAKDAMIEEQAIIRKFGNGSAAWGDGLEWVGKREKMKLVDRDEKGGINPADSNGSSASASPPMTATSDESFDYMARGEASLLLGKRA
ncbi:putative sugarlactone [Phaeomoniella chlamydospora]|uniref:D-arabinono-1,4-lactone oxidase n=1 Tax=Phaeomoniella chlamydospora TaxID=158046 RepID=A0A0G2GPY3_PHACM|nr:putative sugarlactone [Phaeomoniella chlamydospora]